MLTIDKIRQAAQHLVEFAVVMDTETTGLGENDTIVELAAVRAFDRSTVFNALVLPRSPISLEAESVHGISATTIFRFGRPVGKAINELLQAAETSSCAYITAFNLPFDKRLIEQSIHKDTQQDITDILNFLQMTNTHCIMELANRFFHEHLEWCQERSQFKRLSLEKCLKIAGIEREGIAHRALSDALAAADLLRFIAGED